MALAAIDGGGSVRTSPPHQTIDQNKVDAALREIRADIPMNQSQLANALDNPNLNQAERDTIVQTLAREDGQQLRFYANDAARTRSSDGASLTHDQQVIADAVQQAYADGAIGKDDLLRIADANQAGNGAQRFLDILEQGTTTRDPNGVCEVLADGLWARNGHDGLDRAGAALFYTSDPSMLSRNLNTADARAQAFEALVDLNQNNPYAKLPDSLVNQGWRNQALSAEGKLFVSYGQELVDRYTGAHGGKVQTEVLAKFMSQTVLNPDAKGIVLDRARDLVPAIRSTLGNTAQTFLDRAQQAEPGSQAQARAMQQYGRLTASVSGGAALALTEYDAQIKANEESKEAFSGMVGDLVGLTPLGTALDKIPLGGGDQLVEALSNQVYDAMNANPDRPDAALAGVLYDQYAGQVETLCNQLHSEGPRGFFDSAYSAELLNLQQNLNVNLGGHAD